MWDTLILVLQILFSVVGIAIFLATIAGLLVEFDGAKECGWCRKVTCVNTKWWSCDAAAILPDNCVYNVAGNLTTKITCPSVRQYYSHYLMCCNRCGAFAVGCQFTAAVQSQISTSIVVVLMGRNCCECAVWSVSC